MSWGLWLRRRGGWWRMFKTNPRDHQRKVYERWRESDAFMLLWEAGAGKTKPTLDIAAWQFVTGRIGALLVIAPNGVHANWILQEVPKHLPVDNYSAAIWRSNMTAAEERQLMHTVKAYERGEMCIVAMNVDALAVRKIKGKKYQKGIDFIRRFLATYSTMLVLDEIHKFKSNSSRTKELNKLSDRFVTRVGLSGSLSAESPLDVYYPCELIDTAWLPYSAYTTFRAEYATLVRRRNNQASEAKGRDIYYEDVVGYKHTDQLSALLAKKASRVLKKDCLDLPPMTRVIVSVDPTPKQKRIYQQLKDEALSHVHRDNYPTETTQMTDDEFLAWLGVDGADESGKVSATHGGALFGKLLQVCGGSLKDDEGVVHPIDSNKPARLLDLLEEIGDNEQVIFTAWYIAELDQLYELLVNHVAKSVGSRELAEARVIHYRATGKGADQDEARARFQRGEARYFIGQYASMIGVDLTSACYMVQYSQTPGATVNDQSVSRMDRDGQTRPMTLYSLVTSGTLEAEIPRTLQEKAAMNETINKRIGV